ncbi:hypothetical protein EVAR_69372_1 [Eumeta japonica]|uniref:Uncharacterized protein n=1 Tax=Eumeta variegata TaxID=151549 RepID=A0A4C1ZSQ9_EUMVA|nr:hypothetical protein EVAR_69372_1 [Eumeta japonica]
MLLSFRIGKDINGIYVTDFDLLMMTDLMTDLGHHVQDFGEIPEEIIVVDEYVDQTLLLGRSNFDKMVRGQCSGNSQSIFKSNVPRCSPRYE